jgi:hypothetical protein
MVFTFTLNYQLEPGESDVDALVERLAEEGCDDALVGVGQPGRLALEFIREAPSADDAIAGVIEDVRRAVPGARLVLSSADEEGSGIDIIASIPPGMEGK